MSDRLITLFVARHGETDWNAQARWQGQTDVPLNANGRAQAAALAVRLCGRGIARIEASDLLRAAETASIVGQTLGVTTVGRHVELRERSFGVFEGLTQAECEARHPEAWARYRQDFRNTPPGAEPRESVIERMRAAARRLVEAAPPLKTAGALLLVGHGGATRMWLGAELDRTLPPIGNAAALQVSWLGGRVVAVAEVDAPAGAPGARPGSP
jgi:probable phosphoglycerate mutase